MTSNPVFFRGGREKKASLYRGRGREERDLLFVDAPVTKRPPRGKGLLLTLS